MNTLIRLGEHVHGTTAEDPKKEIRPALGKSVIVIEILAAEDLVIKDRNLIGQKTCSDPFVICSQVASHGPKREIGRTKVIKKSLNPAWNTKIDLEVDGDDRILRDGIDLVFEIFDYDLLSSPDFMGSVNVHLDLLQSVTEEWYTVEKGSKDDKYYCGNATGTIHLAMSVTGRCVPALVTGNAFTLPNDRSNLKIAVAWDSDSKVQAEMSCVAVDRNGKPVAKESVYHGHTENVSESIKLYTESSLGYNCLFHIKDARQLAYYFILTVVSTEEGGGDYLTDHLTSVRARFFNNGAETSQTEFRVRSLRPDSTAVVMFRLRIEDANSSSTIDGTKAAWVIEPIDDCYSSVRDFGGLSPQLESYTCDLLPSNSIADIDPTSFMAMMRPSSHIFLRDYIIGDLPDWITFGASWSLMDHGTDLDLSAICLDSNLEEVEIVSFRQLVSRDNTVKHGGDKRNDRNAVGDEDEMIRLSLPSITDRIHHVGFVVNAHSGYSLHLATRLACRLFIESRDIAVHDLDPTELEGKAAVILAGVSRSEDDGRWKFSVYSKGANGNIGHETVDELQKLLRTPSKDPPLKPPQEATDGLPSMPSFVKTAPVDEDHVLIPAFDFVRYINGEEEIVLQ
jgi:tellurium resistance protein TerZ